MLIMNFKIKNIINLLFLLSIMVSIVSCCLLLEYKYINNYEHFSIRCTDSKTIALTNLTIDDKFILLKLEGTDSLKFIIQNKDTFTKIKLYSLDIMNTQNTLEDFMGDINSFSNLKELVLSNNKISIIRTRQFDKLTSLTKLDLSYNEIFYFEVNAFEGYGLNNLLELNLSHNVLFEIEDGTFDGLPKLESLDLSYNKIKRIRSKVFTSLLNIKSLLLNNNRIKTIEDSSFLNLDKLEELLLNDNRIYILNESIFDNLNFIKLNLPSNKLTSFRSLKANVTTLDLSNNKFINIIKTILNYTETSLVIFSVVYLILKII